MAALAWPQSPKKRPHVGQRPKLRGMNMSNAQDAITQITLRAIALPLKAAVSDAKVLTGKQKSLSES